MKINDYNNDKVYNCYNNAKAKAWSGKLTWASLHLRCDKSNEKNSSDY